MTETEGLPADTICELAGAWRGKHPRLFLDAERLIRLRGCITDSHAHLWKRELAYAELLVATDSPVYCAEGGDALANEQLWQREVGYALPHLALAWLLTEDHRFLKAVRRWALASCGYPTWGLGWIDGKDLAAGHQLFGLAVAYDWCGTSLDDEACATIAGTLARQAAKMFAAAAKPSGAVWWSRTPANNHQWVNCGGLAAAGLALFDEQPEAADWVVFARDKFHAAVRNFGPDGAGQEGLVYWAYGVQALLQYMHLACELLGEDLHDHAWWRNTAAYRQYLTLPLDAWSRENSALVNLADCRRTSECGPEHILRRLAGTYRDGHAQWLAGRLEAAGITTTESFWLNLIWFDPTVAEQPPNELPTLRHFEDLGIVSARSDWSGRESQVVFKCGPFAGHQAAKASDPALGSGHAHPDANHFAIFGCGQWLIRDDGYSVKRTSHHNTLLVGGRGQLGEGKTWFDCAAARTGGADPKTIRCISTPNLDYMVGEAAGVYPAECGLRKFVRHLIFLKPDILIVADDIELAAPAKLELLLHPETVPVRGTDGAWTAISERAVLRLEPLRPEGVGVELCEQTAERSDACDKLAMIGLRLGTERTVWRNAVALSWAPTGSQPRRVALQTDGGNWIFTSGSLRVRLDWKSATVCTD
jgi:hypothetical protein